MNRAYFNPVEVKIILSFAWINNFFSKKRLRTPDAVVLPIPQQIKAWRRASHKMGWKIKAAEFENLASPPPLSASDRDQGFSGIALFYGFGEDGTGHADAILSGKLAWQYACRRRKDNIWQCQYVDFEKPADIRLRPGAPARPQGFYYAKIQTGQRFQATTVAQLRKGLKTDTGFAPEGFQLLSVTHPHFPELMSERKIPFMALADYDVAPHGYNDFYDAPQLFSSNSILGLGIGNVDRNYPLFGIPTLQFAAGGSDHGKMRQ